MGLKEDLESEVKQILKESWTVEATNEVPDPDQLRLSNHAKDLETATVLYADLDGSTNMVDNYQWSFSAEIYKAYLRCAARIIAAEKGVVTAYDGDRVMAIFTGTTKNTCAVRAAMKINHAVEMIIRPAIAQQYANKKFTLKHVIGETPANFEQLESEYGGTTISFGLGEQPITQRSSPTFPTSHFGSRKRYTTL